MTSSITRPIRARLIREGGSPLPRPSRLALRFALASLVTLSTAPLTGCAGGVPALDLSGQRAKMWQQDDARTVLARAGVMHFAPTRAPSLRAKPYVSRANAAPGAPEVVASYRTEPGLPGGEDFDLSQEWIARPPSIQSIVRAAGTPHGQEQLKEAMAESGRRWFFGGGIGQTMANAGTVALFPPYALYLLGNIGLSVCGLEPLYITDALPEPVAELHRVVIEVPGRINAIILGEEFVRSNDGTTDQPAGIE